jgi:Xaa-Pro dipeptidase
MDFDTILQGKYPAKQHAKRVVDYIRSKVPEATGVLYLESRMTKLLEDNDEPEPFRYVSLGALVSPLACQHALTPLVQDSAASSTTSPAASWPTRM